MRCPWELVEDCSSLDCMRLGQLFQVVGQRLKVAADVENARHRGQQLSRDVIQPFAFGVHKCSAEVERVQLAVRSVAVVVGQRLEPESHAIAPLIALPAVELFDNLRNFGRVHGRRDDVVDFVARQILPQRCDRFFVELCGKYLRVHASHALELW